MTSVFQANELPLCHGCGGRLRPANTFIKDYPDTKQRATSTTCQTCHRRATGRSIRLTPSQVLWAVSEARRIRAKEDAR